MGDEMHYIQKIYKLYKIKVNRSTRKNKRRKEERTLFENRLNQVFD